jgi:hypothetical protein
VADGGQTEQRGSCRRGDNETKGRGDKGIREKLREEVFTTLILVGGLDCAAGNSRTTRDTGSIGPGNTLVSIQMNNDRTAIVIEETEGTRRERDSAGSIFKKAFQIGAMIGNTRVNATRTRRCA